MTCLILRRALIICLFLSLFLSPLSVWYPSLSAIIHNIHRREKIWCRFWRLLEIFLSLYRLPLVTSVETTVCRMYGMYASDETTCSHILIYQSKWTAMPYIDMILYIIITILHYYITALLFVSILLQCINKKSEVKSDMLGQKNGIEKVPVGSVWICFFNPLHYSTIIF